MRTRVLASLVAIFGLVAGTLAAGASLPAAALSPGLSFSADNLPTWQTNGVVRGVAAAGGRVVAVGDFTQIRPGEGQSGSPRNVAGLVILDAATGKPTQCQLPATVPTGTAQLYAAEASPNGETVFVGGNFSSLGGVDRGRIAEIDPVTCEVTSFQVPGVSSFVYSLTATKDAVYLGGRFDSVAGKERLGFAKVDLSGKLDPNWIANAVGDATSYKGCTVDEDGDTRGLALESSPDGSQIVLGGSFYTVNGENTHSLAVVSAKTGELVRAYPADPGDWRSPDNFIHPCSVTKSIVSDGSYFYGANEGSGSGVFDGTLRLSWATLDQDWRNTCLGAGQALLIKGDMLYQASHNHNCSSMGQYPAGKRVYLSATVPDDPMQNQIGWNPTLNDGTGEGIGGRALTVATSGSDEFLWVGGEFTEVNGLKQQGLTRFGTTDTGKPPTPQIDVRAVTSDAIQITTRAVVDPDDSPLDYILYRDDKPIGDPISAESLWWKQPQVTFVDTDVKPGTEYTYRIRAVDAAGNESDLSSAKTATATDSGSVYAESVMAADPVLYWRYDDSGSWVIDRSGQTGSGKQGVARNGVTYDDGAIADDASNSASFDGKGQYIVNGDIALPPTTYTIETWFNTTSTDGGALVAFGNGLPTNNSNRDVGSSRYDRLIYMEPDTGRIRFGVSDGKAQTLRTDDAYNDGEWHHIVATQGPDGMRLYIDGVEVGSNSVTDAQQFYGTWRVGGSNLWGWPSSGAQYYTGQLDETAIYETVLTPEQVDAHYKIGTGDVPAPDPGPATPSNVEQVGSTTQLTWSESADEVAGYRVYRGTTADFTPSEDSRVGDVTETTWTDSDDAPGTRYYRVSAYDDAGNESLASEALKVTIAEATGPSTPSGLETSVAGSDVSLTWDADEEAVDRYQVYRGDKADFSIDTKKPIGEPTAASYVDSARPDGTWYYRVVALDTDGNASAPSASVPATVDSGDPVAEPVTLTVTATADTMVAQVAPDAVYGTSNQLSSRSGSGGSEIESYLRFELPAAPEGLELTGANIAVTTSNDASATSAGAHQFSLMTGSWSEETTWNSRPTSGFGDQIGELAGAPDLNTTYTVELDADALAAGTTINVAMRSDSTDNLRILSREFSYTSWRPTLELEYTPAK